MHRTIALGIFALITAVSSAYGDDNYQGIVGTYVRENPDSKNAWHYVQINTAPDRGPFAWVNRAGKRWTVESGQVGLPNNGGKKYFLSFGDDSPYPGHALEIVRKQGKVTQLTEFKNDEDLIKGKPYQNWVPKEFR